MDKLDPKNLETKLVEVEDWYSAVIFDEKGSIVARKNASKTDEKELSYFLNFNEKRIFNRYE